ncbi:putative membrane protein YeiH [Acetobacteroides hydrogenigenes]|uniref:Putative membrane protein YeiH n=2 Tax=Acetobacteroides hydrogenigenes TaxID=979970 RepID=A0A4R2EP72_9BACT|nr:putative membrane protein YeiH [Acetobacteroides hydrogenigenes]
MNFFSLLDLIGTFVFAISGTIAAGEKRLDLFGAAFIGFVTAIGGGTLRDMMIGISPVSWTSSMAYLYVIILAVIITFFLKEQIFRFRRTIFLFDTIGIGVFTIIGVEKALANGINTPVAIIMGILTAVAGGVIRDTLNNEVPQIFKKEIYATACFAGAVVYILLKRFGIQTEANQVATILIIIGIRVISVKQQLGLPRMDFRAQ